MVVTLYLMCNTSVLWLTILMWLRRMSALTEKALTLLDNLILREEQGAYLHCCPMLQGFKPFLSTLSSHFRLLQARHPRTNRQLSREALP